MTEKGINVLSLFDGMSCGRIALERAGINVEKYYASEIDKPAQAVSRYNYPNILRLGDVTKWREWNIDWSSIDLLIGGSPCQGFSFAGKQLAFDDPRSKLFFEYVDILNHLKSHNPNVKFLLENVRMKKEHLNVISEYLGVQPIMINSSLVSAQNRVRYYWCNWSVNQPEDKRIMLKDIVHENTMIDRDKSLCLLAGYDSKFQIKRYFEKHIHQGIFEKLNEYIVPFDKTLKILEKEIERGKVGYFRKDSQANRVYYIHDKAVTLCGDAGGGAAKMGQYLFGATKANGQGDRVYSEEEKSPTLNASSGGTAGKGNCLFGYIAPDSLNKKQNGQRFSEGKKFYTLTAQDKHGILIEGYIRKLTPIECERLQTLPDNYTGGASNSQRYKMLGNGWTVDVIAHILKQMEV